MRTSSASKFAFTFLWLCFRFGVPLGAQMELEDTLWAGLTDTFCKLPMALTAEKLADKFGITRDQVDEYALRSQTLYKKG